MLLVPRWEAMAKSEEGVSAKGQRVVSCWGWGRNSLSLPSLSVSVLGELDEEGDWKEERWWEVRSRPM
jgi:hypothetical protein